MKSPEKMCRKKAALRPLLDLDMTAGFLPVVTFLPVRNAHWGLGGVQ